jgi:hypothetical protein
MKKFLIACALLSVFSSVGLFAEQSISIAPQCGFMYGRMYERPIELDGPFFGVQVDWMISDNWGLGLKCAVLPFVEYAGIPPFVGIMGTYQFDNGLGLSLVLGLLPGIELRYANFILDLGFIAFNIDGWVIGGTASLGYSLRIASW